jgi:uncharacterized protein (TIRG00374 family)
MKLPLGTSATVHNTFDSVRDSLDDFLDNLAHIHLLPLGLALILFGCYLTVRSRASFNILRAAYPDRQFRWLHIWAAYIAGYGFNSVIPARSGDLVRLFLTRNAIPRSSYPTVASSFFVETIFDICSGIVTLSFAFTQGVFPKPPDFSEINASTLSFFASNPQFTLFFFTASVILVLVAFALLSAKVKRFWARIGQGIVILKDRRRYLRQVWGVQFVAWWVRFAAFWFLLDAFNINGSLRNVMLVFGVNAIASALPFTPGGAGVQQALLVQVFASVGAGTVAVYSVGQQVSIAAFSFVAGFVAMVTVFKLRSFKDVIRRGRAEREAEKT